MFSLVFHNQEKQKQSITKPYMIYDTITKLQLSKIL